MNPYRKPQTRIEIQDDINWNNHLQKENKIDSLEREVQELNVLMKHQLHDTQRLFILIIAAFATLIITNLSKLFQ